MPANIQCLDVEKINSWKMHLKIVGFCEYQKAHSKKWFTGVLLRPISAKLDRSKVNPFKVIRPQID